MFIAKTLSFYKDPRVRELITEHARNKEIAVKFASYFGKRPEAIFADGDVLDFAKQKATSFHCSEELWRNPLHIKTGMGKKEVEELRIGWDLILDIDCPYWPLSKLITHLFIKSLQAHDVSSVTVKFSGNKGFHIAVPFESFPESVNGTPTKDLFPEAPRRIAHYLLDYIVREYVSDEGDYYLFDKKYKITKEKLGEAFDKPIEHFSKKIDMETGREINENKPAATKIPLLCHNCGYNSTTEKKGLIHKCPRCSTIMTEEDLKEEGAVITSVFNPLTVVEVDTILIAHRHMYRMPYSFHEKSQLVSVPIHIDEVLTFKKSDAEPGRLRFDVPFLHREGVEAGEASQLFLAAYDWKPDIEREEYETKKEFEIPEEAIPEQYFPPCITIILQGVKDGRKRSLFTLINFLRGVGWSHEQIEERITQWNELNDEKLREVTVKGRLRYEKTKKEHMPPHNCRRYYEDFGVCKPDNICNTIKNPLQYAKKKAAMAGIGKKGAGRAKLTEEQKAARRKHRAKLKEQAEGED